MTLNFYPGNKSDQRPLLESRLLRRAPELEVEPTPESGPEPLPESAALVRHDNTRHDKSWRELMPGITLPRLSLPRMPQVRIEIKPSVREQSLSNLKTVQHNLRGTWQAGMREHLVDENMKKNWASSLQTLKNTLADSLREPKIPTAREQVQGLDDIFPDQVRQISPDDVGATATAPVLEASPPVAPPGAPFNGTDTFERDTFERVHAPSAAPAEPGLTPQLILLLQSLIGGLRPDVEPTAARPSEAVAPVEPAPKASVQTVGGVFTPKEVIETSFEPVAHVQIADEPVAQPEKAFEAPFEPITRVQVADEPVAQPEEAFEASPDPRAMAAELLKSLSDEIRESQPAPALPEKLTAIADTTPCEAEALPPASATDATLITATPEGEAEAVAAEDAEDYSFQTILRSNKIINSSITTLAQRYFENAAREEAEQRFEY